MEAGFFRKCRFLKLTRYGYECLSCKMCFRPYCYKDMFLKIYNAKSQLIVEWL